MIPLAAPLRRLLTVLSILAVLAAMQGCRTMQRDQTAKFGKPSPYKADWTVTRTKSGGAMISLQYGMIQDTSKPINKFMSNVVNLDICIYDEEYAPLDTLSPGLVSSVTGFTIGIDSLYMLAEGRWRNPMATPFTALIIDAVLTMNDSTRYHDAVRFELPAGDSIKPIEYMTVKGDIDEQTDSTITFGLLATRNRGVHDDYHPTSERMRLEIYSQKGVLLYGSNHGMNFLQSVGQVEPNKIGDNKRFVFMWGGTDNDGNILPKGRYKAKLTLVTRPFPYSTTIDFDWKGNPK
ncbi:MAG: hypothetical protein JNL32_12580 [Candidatus Kapabacteria bacterium]|nr:hypothetical protein [Candidatus Kapabacteria bacterium]